MTKSGRGVFLVGGIVLVCGLVLFLGILAIIVFRFPKLPISHTPDFGATLQALIASGPIASPSPIVSATAPTASTIVPAGEPSGHIVWTCQLYKYQSSNQICIMNADGSSYRRLTTEDGLNHYYPSLAPDGGSIVYSQYREDNVYEIYELTLADGVVRRVTDRLGTLTGPAISPDGKSIAFTHWTVASDQEQIWVIDRDGGNARRVFNDHGWDPTWSPTGAQILFASDRDGSNQLYIGNLDGRGLHKISSLSAIRGRSDWSSQNMIATYSGDAWKREIYVMYEDGSNQHRVSPPGGNSQGPSFSPDGRWIAFTAYYDKLNDINGCEIYIMRVDGSDLRRLTNNDYCDYQPRWGP